MVFEFLKPKKRPPFDKIETVIGSNSSFEGHLKCDGNIRIDGVCEGGVIQTVGNVVVSLGGRVAAQIIAEHVSGAGEVTGAIYARGHLEILGTGRVSGDVYVTNFYKDETGILSGKLTMGKESALIVEQILGKQAALLPAESINGIRDEVDRTEPPFSRTKDRRD
jgi:cytoskeletal protein CcmA (bactofilin family)